MVFDKMVFEPLQPLKTSAVSPRFRVPESVIFLPPAPLLLRIIAVAPTLGVNVMSSSTTTVAPVLRRIATPEPPSVWGLVSWMADPLSVKESLPKLWILRLLARGGFWR